MLDAVHFVSIEDNAPYYEECIGFTGGFGKYPGVFPDLVHTSLGICSLAIMGNPQLKQVYGPLGISKDATSCLQLKQVTRYTTIN